MTSEHRKSKESRAKEKKKNQARRCKRIKNALKHFKIFYQNIRGIKPMVVSLTETVDDTNPTIICIVETTHMLKEEEIKLPGYETVFRGDGTNNSGGKMVAVKGDIKTITMQIQHENAKHYGCR